jgi:membrane protein required for colicin V production
MNWVDYTMLAVLAIFLLYGFTRGFVRQVIGIAGILAGLFLASRYSTALAESEVLRGMRNYNAKIADIAAFIAILLGTALVVGIVVALIARHFPKRELKPTDSFLGAVLGGLQGILILGGISIALLDWNDPRADPMQESVLAPKLAEGCKALVSLIPEQHQIEIKKEFEKGTREVERTFADPPPAGIRSPEGNAAGPDGKTSDGSFSSPNESEKTTPAPEDGKR